MSFSARVKLTVSASWVRAKLPVPEARRSARVKADWAPLVTNRISAMPWASSCPRLPVVPRREAVSAWTVNRTEDARALLSLGVDDVITDKPEMVQDLLNEDADLDRNLVLMRDRLKELLGLTESADSEVDPDDSAIEEVLEDPEELLDQA